MGKPYYAEKVKNFARSDAKDFLSLVNLGLLYDAATYECGKCGHRFDANSNKATARCPYCDKKNVLC